MRPPHILSYFNAGHHLALYQVAGHLRRTFGCEVDAADCAVQQTNWKQLSNMLFRNDYDFIVLMNDFDGTDGFPRTINYIQEVSPRSRLVTFGRFSGMAPSYFHNFALDAVVTSGDFEAGVEDAIRSVLADSVGVPGVDRRRSGDWYESPGAGRLIDPEDWVLPAACEIPYLEYDRLYADDSARFSGLPAKRELVLPVARGCPVGCHFCEVPSVFGRKERRISVGRTVEYIASSFKDEPFDYVSFYAPTFTLNRDWVIDLTNHLTALSDRVEWKCCTTLHHLDEDLIEMMAESGCVRISVGVETLDEAGGASLPRVKRPDSERTRQVAVWCQSHGIELNCFVIVGLPGTSLDGVEATYALLHKLGARIRPTVYTPYFDISRDHSPTSVMDFNRQLLNFSTFETPEERRRAYSLLLDDSSITGTARLTP